MCRSWEGHGKVMRRSCEGHKKVMRRVVGTGPTLQEEHARSLT